jgi:dipeptidyl aminopeptidase/acylaminoacyl peptidase
MNADGSGAARLPFGGDFARYPGWSPDGAKIVFADHPNIYSATLDGSVVTQLTNSAETDIRPHWSPDGKTILFTRVDSDGDESYWLMNSDGSGEVQIGAGLSVADPQWSPNPARLVFAAESGLWSGDTNFFYWSGILTETYSEFEHFPDFSPDGTKVVYERTGAYPEEPSDVLTVAADGSETDGTLLAPYATGADWQPIPVNSYPRPKSAASSKMSLVPAYARCTASNRTHGPPLTFGSCHPPAQASGELTLGTADANGTAAQGSGFLRYRVVGPSDVQITAKMADVYERQTMTDYTGELRARTTLRITDKLNTPHPGGPGAGTVSDTTLAATVPCAPNPNQGADCTLVTSADALAPGIVIEGRRAIWELGQVQVDDGGADGDADTPGDNTLFMTQGLFVP